MKKLFISIFTCVFALFALGTSTFAWFSMNKTANVEGIKFEAYMDSDLLIANYADVVSEKAISANSTSFKNKITATTVDPVTALTHSSSVDGKAFFVASGNIDASGYNEPGTAEADKAYVAATNEGTAKNYFEQAFVVKYYNSGAEKQYVDLTNLKISYTAYSNNETDNSKATRIAFLTSAAATYVEGEDTATLAEKLESLEFTSEGVYSLETAKYFSEYELQDDGTWKAIEGTTSKLAVNASEKEREDSLDDVIEPNPNHKDTSDKGHLYECLPGVTTFFVVKVVVWIEGEDFTCNNTVYTPLLGQWSISFELSKSGTSGKTQVEYITK